MSAQGAPQSDDRIEKLITVLGQGIRAQNEIMRAITISLQAIESHLR
jgi:hypothetical protein